jgi:hypothetical protein
MLERQLADLETLLTAFESFLSGFEGSHVVAERGVPVGDDLDLGSEPLGYDVEMASRDEAFGPYLCRDISFEFRPEALEAPIQFLIGHSTLRAGVCTFDTACTTPK